MSFAIRTALVAVPAIFTLLVGLAFVVLVLILAVQLIRTLPLLRRALQVYIDSHTPPPQEEEGPA